jgi:hypothetical protein
MECLVSQKDGDTKNVIRDNDISTDSGVIWRDLNQINRSKKDEIDEEIVDILNGLRGIADDISLVLKFYYGSPNDEDNSGAIALIPGDASDYVLDYLAQLETKEQQHHKYLAFLRASHHGTRYGKYIDDHKSIVTWISWTKRFSRSIILIQNWNIYQI